MYIRGLTVSGVLYVGMCVSGRCAAHADSDATSNFASNSFQVHFKFTSLQLRHHFNFTSVSLQLPVVIRFHIDFTAVSPYPSVILTKKIGFGVLRGLEFILNEKFGNEKTP